MSWQNIWQLAKSDYFKLVPILALALYIAFMPHLNYPYPLHIDEWVHLAYSKAILASSSTTFVDPFLGQSTIGLSTNLETGFQLFWGVFHSISGISWLTIFRYLPAVIFLITVLSVYVLARREGFGWEAALFTCLIPTTVGIMGPAFMVPVAMGLLFIPLSLFVAFNFRTWWSYLVLFALTSALLSIHAPTALGLVIILVPYILFNVRSDLKHSLRMALALGIPILIPFLWISQTLLREVKPLLGLQLPLTYVDVPQLLQTYGYLPIGFSLLGVFLLALRGGKKNYGLVLGLLALLLMLASFFTFNYGIQVMYYRGLMWMMLMLGIVAGAGLMGLKNFRLPERLSARLKAPLITQNAGKFLCVVLIGLTLATTIPDRQDTLYYQMIDTEDYEAFVWIRNNVDENHEKAILDPWKATAFTAITGKHIYTRIHAFPIPSDEEAYAFLRGGSMDTAFMRENKISIVYSQWKVNNPDLREVRKNIYLLQQVDSQ